MRPITCSPVPHKVLEPLALDTICSITTRPNDSCQFSYKAKRCTFDVVSCLIHAETYILIRGTKPWKLCFSTSEMHLVHCHKSLLLVDKTGAQLLYYSQPLPSAIPNNCGVLQDAVLSPSFFTLHTSDLFSESLASFLKYASDDFICLLFKDAQGISIINNALNYTSGWRGENGLNLNPNKCFQCFP